jgi:hypothetical protein
MIASLILSFSLLAYGQDSGGEASTPVLLESRFTMPSERHSVQVSHYSFVYSKVSLTEILISDPNKLAAEMSAHLKTLQKCGTPAAMFYKKHNVGSRYWCEQENSAVLIYSYGEKIYIILSDSQETVVAFTKAILPLACHVHGATDCISMFY